MAINYLHYYFVNDIDTPFDNTSFFENKKRDLLQKEIQAFKNNRLAITSKIKNNNAISKEYEKVLEAVMNPGVIFNNQIREQEYSFAKNSVSPDRVVTVQGKEKTISANSIGRMSANQIAEHFDNILNTIVDFQESLDQALAKSYDIIAHSSSFEAYKNSIIANYAVQEGVQIAGKDFAQKVLQNFFNKKLALTSDFFQDNLSDKMKTSMAKLILVAEAIKIDPTYTGSYATSTHKGTINSAEDFLKILAGKVGGLYSNIKGGTEELAVTVGEKNAIRIIAKEHKKIMKNVKVEVAGENTLKGSNIMCTIDTKEDPILSFDYRPDRRTVSKPDVKITYSENGVSVHYGITVKNYTEAGLHAGTNNKYIKPDIVRDTPFDEAASRIFSGTGIFHMYQLAAGHGNGGTTKIKLDPNLPKITNQEISDLWDSFKDLVVAGNLLSFLGGYAEDNILFMAINGNVIPLDRILQNILNGVTNYSYSLKGNKLSHDSLMRKNVWEKIDDDTPNANVAKMKRTSQAMTDISAKLHAAKLTVSLEILLTQ